MKFYIKFILSYTIVTSFIAWTIFAPMTAKAEVYLMGDSWLAGTFNPLAADHVAGFTEAVTKSFAVDSQSSANLAASISSYPMQDGGVAVIDIGLPDFFNGIDETDVKNNMFLVVDYLHEHDIEVILSCPARATSHDDLTWKIAEQTLKSAREMCNEIADRWPGFIHIVELQAKLMPIDEFSVTPGDPVHLNADGYFVYNIALADEIRKAKGFCHLLYSVHVDNFFAQHPELTEQQKCTVGNLVQEFWLN